jgi:hypothetical protein
MRNCPRALATCIRGHASLPSCSWSCSCCACSYTASAIARDEPLACGVLPLGLDGESPLPEQFNAKAPYQPRADKAPVRARPPMLSCNSLGEWARPGSSRTIKICDLFPMASATSSVTSSRATAVGVGRFSVPDAATLKRFTRIQRFGPGLAETRRSRTRSTSRLLSAVQKRNSSGPAANTSFSAQSDAIMPVVCGPSRMWPISWARA